MARDIFLWILILYYGGLFVFGIFILFTKRKTFLWMNWIIALLLPIAGLGILWLMRKQFRVEMKSAEFLTEFVPEQNKSLFYGDRKQDLLVTSLTDILLFEDVATRRDAVMKIFSGDSMQYVKELKKALADPDTEVSHYASSALTEIKRKFDNSVIEMGKLVTEEPSQQNQLLFAKTLYDYIESGILDPANRKKYQRQFCHLILKLFELRLVPSDGMNMNYYKATALYLYDLGQKNEAMSFIADCLTSFDDEVIYFAALELYYLLGERTLFQQTIQRIRLSRTSLSPEKLASFRYFIGATPSLPSKEVVRR
ncbi:hypothetical protein SDC9_106728 [bioreactor metagenome]|uniref:HEAT repeat domain-containing protein n=1 Tax=bioreactor metagenome TaxID=1076179 RepID=A0A645B351_9ZZZZ